MQTNARSQGLALIEVSLYVVIYTFIIIYGNAKWEATFFWKKMSQVLDILPSILFYNVTNSWFFNNHNSRPLYLHSTIQNTTSETYDSSNTTYWRPFDKLQKGCQLMKKITLSFHAFTVFIARVYYTHNLQNG